MELSILPSSILTLLLNLTVIVNLRHDTQGGFLSRDGANVCWLFSFFAIHEDYFRHIVCAIKLAKSFITLNSFRSVQYKAAVEMCSVMLCISCSRPMAEQWQYVQREYVALPQIQSLWWAFLFHFFAQQLCTWGTVPLQCWGTLPPALEQPNSEKWA